MSDIRFFRKDTMNKEYVKHTLPPQIDSGSKILILGTMPSPKSRETGFYYGHPQNRFWRLLSDLFSEPKPETIEEKKAFLSRHHIALWDTLKSCSIYKASDASIQDPIPNDIKSLVEGTQIQHVFVTGKQAEKFYTKYCGKPLPYTLLPSPSSANQTKKYEAMLDEYRAILSYL